jgi:hypothetical protein
MSTDNRVNFYDLKKILTLSNEIYQKYYHKQYYSIHKFTETANDRYECEHCLFSMDLIQSTRKKGDFLMPVFDQTIMTVDPDTEEEHNVQTVLKEPGKQVYDYKSVNCMSTNEFDTCELKILGGDCGSCLKFIVCIDT